MIDLVRHYRHKLNYCCTLRRAFTYENKSHVVHGSAVYSLRPYTLAQPIAAQTKEGQAAQQQIRRNPNICNKATALEIHLVTCFPNLT